MSRYKSSSFKTSSSSSFGSSGSKFSKSKTFSKGKDKEASTDEAAMSWGVKLKKLPEKKLLSTGDTSKSVSTSANTKTSTSVSTSKSTHTSKSFATTSSASAPKSASTLTSASASTTATASAAVNVLKSTRINIDQEKIPDFAVARPRILPVLKPQNWERSTKDMLKKVDPKHPPDVLYFPVKTIPGSTIGYTLAIVNEEGSMHYILRSYLDAWNIPEKVLMDVAIRNLEHRLENRGTRLWKRSKAGVYYLDNLGAVSASVILLPQFLDGLDIEDQGDPIIVAPCGDICLVGGAKSDTQLCIMGEIALHYSKDPQRFDMKPLRFSKNRFHDYAPKTYAKEHNVPQTLDEVRTIRLRLKPLKISREK